MAQKHVDPDSDPQHCLIAEMKTLELGAARDDGPPGLGPHGTVVIQGDLFPETWLQGQGLEPLVYGGDPAQLGMGQEGEDPQHHLVGHPLEGRTTL